MARRFTTIDLVNKCDGFPQAEKEPERFAQLMEGLYTLVWEDEQGPFPIGYMPQSVVDALAQTPAELIGHMNVEPAKRTVSLFTHLKTEAERTKHIGELTAYWRTIKAFRILDGWRNELWPVYGRNGDKLLFSMERAAIGLFGTVRYGVHMTAFTRHSASDDDEGRKSQYDLRIWVPKRAATKPNYPGMLDNTVAGGLMTDEDPFECIIREADEEASLPEAVMRAHAKEVGTVTYVYITDERAGGEPGYIYPECQWVYDLELPVDGAIVPCPKDGEVESFAQYTVEEIKEQLAQGLWKPNCALVMLDFFLRHGVLTPENEPDYKALRDRAHRSIPFPGPHQTYRLKQ
ncbi:NUDIX hydrolase domain-like protein [Bombardia bombarda]|uniref:NUDIX hydrolase domain-like protein n=1 Tax=Bombardia bombarda TaxID=252184 RepID=A0AA40C9B2_9PEZI|nr:NUDIX hydrolase domain-like protein [Bombardia bombarda]